MLTHVEFAYVFDGYEGGDSVETYRRQWLVWSADGQAEPFGVMDWSTRWSAKLDAGTETLDR